MENHFLEKSSFSRMVNVRFTIQNSNVRVLLRRSSYKVYNSQELHDNHLFLE
jgi:hypothetical protein